MTNARAETDPDEIEVEAIDIIPYRAGILCTVGTSEPFVNMVVNRSWSEDGTKIWFMLESHNFYSAKPDELVKVVPCPCRHKPLDRKQFDTVAFLVSRPTPPAPKCPHCGK